jgi:phospholipid/cholesterol/gamma-HCH transport system substrate-binding protein
METRAHHLLIGAFVALMTIALFAFLVWVAKVDINQPFDRYQIYFEESVAGLSKAGDVRYNGIPVGQVTNIDIPEDDPTKARVTVRIRSEVPILESSVAVLATWGLTGVLFVQIENEDPDSLELSLKPGQEMPVIRSRVSPIQEFFVGGPNLINSGVEVLAEIKRLLSPENQKKFGEILGNTEKLTSEIADHSADFKTTLGKLDTALDDLKETSVTVRKFVANADAALDQDFKKTMGTLQSAATSIDQLAQDLDGLIAENRTAISNFSNATLPEISRLILDARRLARSLAGLAERLEDNPGSLIFSPPKPEHGNK